MCYIWYIAETKPHIEDMFNGLEMFNEILFAFTVYTFMGYIVTNVPSLLTA